MTVGHHSYQVLTRLEPWSELNYNVWKLQRRTYGLKRAGENLIESQLLQENRILWKCSLAVIFVTTRSKNELMLWHPNLVQEERNVSILRVTRRIVWGRSNQGEQYRKIAKAME
nr:uncharacterized protein LOC131768895 [Pocillopora verrucosa]